MWRKHRSTSQDHVKYIHNEIVKPFGLGIIQYYERVRDMRDLANYPPPPSVNGKEYDEAYWAVRYK